MKSHMKCFSVLALIAFGFGYTDLLVRPCWAHNNGSSSHLLLHGVDHAVHDAINDARDAVDAAVDAAVEELNEWVDSGGEVIHFVSSYAFSSESDTTPSSTSTSTTDYYDPHMGFDPNKGTSEERAPTYQENPAEEKCYPLTSSDPSDYCGDTDDDDD